MMTDLQYYDNEENWGSHQYVTVEEVINNYLANRDSDDYTSMTPRHKILYQAYRGVRELYFDSMSTIRAYEMTISPTLSVIVPPDYVDYVRISLVDNQGRMQPIAIDKKMAIAERYLQDNAFNILFDSEGYVLTDAGDANNNNEDFDEDIQPCTAYSIGSAFSPNKDNSQFFPNGRFNIDKNRGVIQFSSDVSAKTVVIEYISDGLYVDGNTRKENNIKVHKFAESALIDFIYYELIKQRRNVPANEKMRARKEYYNSRRLAQRRLNKFTKEEFLQMVKGSTKWIK